MKNLSEIDIYCDYVIDVCTFYNYIPKDECLYGIDCNLADDYTKEIVNGAMLLEILKLKFSQDNLSNVYFNTNRIMFCNFDECTNIHSITDIRYKRKGD